MRVIIRARMMTRPGAQLRITDTDDDRITAFATNTRRGQLAHLELRHRRRAEDRMRCAKDTGLTNLPLHNFDQNQIWLAITALACELTTWTQLFALTGRPARRWEPNNSDSSWFSTAARRVLVRLPRHDAWAHLTDAGITRLRELAALG